MTTERTSQRQKWDRDVLFSNAGVMKRDPLRSRWISGAKVRRQRVLPVALRRSLRGGGRQADGKIGANS